MNQNFEMSDSGDSSECNKVFVGNVPFQCTTDEFQNCFRQIKGFVNADIIRRYKSKLSRGFGFVIFDNQESAKKLMESTVILRDRKLRFSPYSFDFKQRAQSAPPRYQNYQVFVRNLDEMITNDVLKAHFGKYGEIVSCFITSKNGKAYAVISFKNESSYMDTLENEEEFEVFQYKKRKRQAPNQQLRDPGTIYREGFRAGHIVGYQQGFQEGIRQVDTTKNQ